MKTRLEGFSHKLPLPNLPVACGVLLLAYVLLMAARVIPLPGSVLGAANELFGIPVRVIARVFLYTVALILLFGSYVYAMHSVRGTQRRRLGRIVLAFTIVLMIPALVNPDLFSNDVYGYIFYGRMYGVYGLNPYVTLPGDAPADPFLAHVDWRNLISPYGPVWTSWSVVLDAVTPGGVRAHVVAFKLSAAGTHLLNTLLVGAIVRQVSPRNTALAMAAYGWNPLPLTEFAGNAHNDSMMLLWVLAALLSHYHRRAMIGAIMLGLGIATKFTALLFVPFYILALVRRGGDVRLKVRRVLSVGAVMGLVWVVSWLPYVQGGGWRQMFVLPPQSAWYLNSLPAVAYSAIRGLIVWVGDLMGSVGLGYFPPVWAGDVADGLVRAISIVLILTVGLVLGRQVRYRSDLVEMWFWFFFVYLFFVGPYFWPWYATSLVSLAAISRRRYVWIAATMLSLSAMVVYSCSNCRSYFRAADSALTGLIIFVVPLLTLLIVALRDHSHHSPASEGALEVG